MKTLSNSAKARHLMGILISLSIGFALILFNARISKGNAHQNLPLTSNSIRTKVQQIYTSQIGVREKGMNAGAEVEKYLRYVHLSKGNPWCAAFVCWVLGEAGVDNPRSGWSPSLFGKDRVIWEKGEPGTRSQESRFPQSVPITFSYCTKHNCRAGIRCACPPPAGVGGGFNSLLPTTGDIFGLYFPEKKRIAHTGFIDEWDGTWMISVEGNTNLSGSREGDGVYRKRRLVRTIYKVARFIRN